jgi:hypothetical protein
MVGKIFTSLITFVCTATLSKQKFVNKLIGFDVPSVHRDVYSLEGGY